MKQFIVRQLAFVAVLCMMVGYASAQTPTLTHYLPFDGDLSDTAAGTYANSLWSSVDMSSAGVSGNAAYFNGSDTIVLLQGTGVLPSSGGWTVSFWEYALMPADNEPDGYFFSDAATNPLNNLYIRRYMEADPADPENSEISTPNGKIGGTDTRGSNYAKYHPTSVATGTWVNHTITLTDEGQSYWYVNGQLQTFIYSTEWTGLKTQDPENPSGYEGLTVGNRIDGLRTYYGYFDEFQIYSGAVDGGMVNYLYNNPGATLATYDPVTYPDPGLPDIMPGPTSVLHWTFDTDLSEAGGTTGATGTAIGDAVVQAGTGVNAGGALYLDGDDDAVSILGSLVPTGSVSLSFWAKTDGTTNGYMLCDSENYSNFFIRRDTNDTSMITGGIGNDKKAANIENMGPYPEDTWQHIVVISSQETGEVYCYVDGVIAETSNYARTEEEATGVLVGLLSDLYIGNRYAMDRDFKGWIDDLQIYDGTLTADEVAFLCDNPGQDLFAVPEPSTIILLLGAVLGLFIIRRR